MGNRYLSLIKIQIYLFIIINHCFGALAWYQVDNFDRADGNNLGTTSFGGLTWSESEPSGDEDQLQILSNQIYAYTSGVSGNEPTSASIDLSGLGTIDLGADKYGWSFWFNLKRNPSGWGISNYSAGWVLVANESDFSTETVDGYAVVWNATNDELVLANISDGINATDAGTSVISSTLDWDDSGSDGVNVRVEVDESGNWTMYWELGTAITTASEIDANSGTSGSADNTYFSDENLKYSGPLWNHSTATTSTSRTYFDNFNVAAEDNSLPVELTSFTATSRSGKVVLQWITESEIENLGFLLYRQARGQNYELLDHFRTNRLLSGQGSVTHRTEYKYTDEKVRVGQTYAYLLVDVDYHGMETRHDPVSVTVRACGIAMKSAYPNPFNPVTKFTIIVGDPQHLSINVYDVTGRLVKTLTNKQVPAGEHIIAWDGTNGSNQPAASGIYFVRLVANGATNIQKVVLTR
ncbi:MAG: T9SS type A sorting domain-containing protein [Candidatus Marinimicrobia bacterium]|nr:T9SS type A sorting domain-containing protein [Candidatus Neomarinimicrobiota bacterium]